MLKLTVSFLLVINGAAWAAAEAGFPTVSWKGGLLLANPAPDHSAESPAVEILESEECSARPASKTSLRVTGKCEFLKGLFSYGHREPKSGREMKTHVGFTFSSQGSGHVLMVSGPFVVGR